VVQPRLPMARTWPKGRRPTRRSPPISTPPSRANSEGWSRSSGTCGIVRITSSARSWSTPAAPRSAPSQTLLRPSRMSSQAPLAPSTGSESASASRSPSGAGGWRSAPLPIRRITSSRRSCWSSPSTEARPITRATALRPGNTPSFPLVEPEEHSLPPSSMAVTCKSKCWRVLSTGTSPTRGSRPRAIPLAPSRRRSTALPTSRISPGMRLPPRRTLRPARNTATRPQAR
jgi:hypothetical protein